MNADMIMWLTIVGTNIGTSVGIYKYFNARLSRVYERLDEVKSSQEETYVRKDMCDVLHKNTALSLVGTETRLTGRLDKLEEKFDNLICLLTEKK